MNVPLTPIRFKQRAAKLHAKKVGVVCGEERFTYQEFDNRVDRLSEALTRLGVNKGDRVAYLSYNCHRLLEAYFGVVQMGGVLLPLNIRLSAQEILYILNDSGVKVLFFNADFLGLVESIRRDAKSIAHYISLDRADRPSWVETEYEEILIKSSALSFSELDLSKINEDDLAEIFYTSGTTGDPKGVMLTHRNLYLHALNVIAALPPKDTDVQLHTIPLFHVNGWGIPQTLTCAGGRHVMIKRFEPKLVLELIEKERVTSFSMVPTMARALLNYPEMNKYNLTSLSYVMIGGAAASVKLIKEVEQKLKCRCYSGYGLTETSPVLTIALLKGHLESETDEKKARRKAMTGYEIPGVEIRVVDEDGKDVKKDGVQVGEIVARGDGIMKGYWRQPGATKEVIKDGWFHTGDMATVDEENYILIVDRKKDLIISGGENIASIEIENVLNAHPAILECAIIAVPDSKWGEIPKALVVLKDGVNLSEHEVVEYCKQKLAGFKVPKSVEFLKSLPKGGTGKILKRGLREKYWKDYEKRVH